MNNALLQDLKNLSTQIIKETEENYAKCNKDIQDSNEKITQSNAAILEIVGKNKIAKLISDKIAEYEKEGKVVEGEVKAPARSKKRKA